MLTDRQRQIMALRDGEGLTFAAIADRLGLKGKASVHRSYKAAKAKLAEKQARLDPGVHKTLGKLGLGDMAGQHSGWVHKEDPETGEWASVYYFLGKDGEQSADLEQLVAAAVEKVAGLPSLADPVAPCPTGDNLLVLDVADLHIGKLSVAAETGHTYNREIAVHRGIAGVRALLDRAKAHGLGHILFVIGNDIIHVDDPRGKTTSGTPQDTDGTLGVMFDDAFAFYVAVIDECRAVAPVTLLHCPSNHDWFAGFALARCMGAYYRDAPEVSASDYNTSMRHRKYFRYGRSLIGVTHGDGIKEADLLAAMVREAGEHVGGGALLYWYLHHLHHKIAKRGAGSLQRQTEKDHMAMTVIRDTAGLAPEDGAQIEYLRSASAPDGWHDRNGYVNRQAVEAFMHHPQAGQFIRFTEWF